jgi:hypothetical protein
MSERFGSFLVNGDDANVFRFTAIEPELSRGIQIEFDFRGVTNMTSSFCNALIASLVAQHVTDFRDKMRFKNCNPVIQEMILGAIALGRREAAKLV